MRWDWVTSYCEMMVQSLALSGMSVPDIALMSGLSPAKVYALRKGESLTISVETLMRLEKAVRERLVEIEEMGRKKNVAKQD